MPHLLRVKIGREWLGLEIACPGVDVGDCQMWQDTSEPWPDDFTCSCPGVDCGCRDGDHGCCSSWVDDIGYKCRCEPSPGCGVRAWQGNVSPEEMLGGPNEWAADIYPIPVRAVWDEGFTLAPWGEQ